MGQDCVPRRRPVVTLDPAMSFGKGEVLQSHPVMFDQRMVLKGRRRKFCCGWIYYGAFVLCAFDENGNDGRGNLPAIVSDRLIEEVAIVVCRRQ
jgi:hypothetical protein